MTRHVIAAVAACLYIAGSIWLVQSQGRAYRAGLNQENAGPMAINVAPPTPTVKVQSDPPVATVEKGQPRHQSEIPPVSVPAPVAGVPHKPAVDPVAPPAPPQVELARATPVRTPTKTHTANKSSAKQAPAHPLAGNAFWSRPELTKVWDVASFKLDDERRLGYDLHELIVHFNPLVKDPSAWIGRLEDAAAPLLPRLRRKDTQI